MKRLFELLKIEIYSTGYFFFYSLPGYYFSNKLRGLFICVFLKKSGKNFNLNREVIIESPQNVEIGDNLQINARCWISGGGNLLIGNNVLIGPHVVIHTANHNFQDRNKPIGQQGHTFKSVKIEDDVWLGANCTILPGVTIGSGCVIAAGAVVTKDTEAFGIYAGVPAKQIGKRM